MDIIRKIGPNSQGSSAATRAALGNLQSASNLLNKNYGVAASTVVKLSGMENISADDLGYLGPNDFLSAIREGFVSPDEVRLVNLVTTYAKYKGMSVTSAIDNLSDYSSDQREEVQYLNVLANHLSGLLFRQSRFEGYEEATAIDYVIRLVATLTNQVDLSESSKKALAATFTICSETMSKPDTIIDIDRIVPVARELASKFEVDELTKDASDFRLFSWSQNLVDLFSTVFGTSDELPTWLTPDILEVMRKTIIDVDGSLISVDDKHLKGAFGNGNVNVKFLK